MIRRSSLHCVIPTSPSLASPTGKRRLRREWNAPTDACQAPSADCAYVFTGSTEGTESSGKGVQTATCAESTRSLGNDRTTAAGGGPLSSAVLTVNNHWAPAGSSAKNQKGKLLFTVPQNYLMACSQYLELRSGRTFFFCRESRQTFNHSSKEY